MYSTISIPDVAHFMGMSEEDAMNCMFLNQPSFVFNLSMVVPTDSVDFFSVLTSLMRLRFRQVPPLATPILQQPHPNFI